MYSTGELQVSSASQLVFFIFYFVKPDTNEIFKLY